MNIDEALGRLAMAPVHPDLDELDDAVFARIRIMAERDKRMPARLTLVAAIGAVTMGIVGADIPVATASAAASLSPLGAAPPLAPSSLLLGDR